MSGDDVVGSVVGVHGFRVNVELRPEVRSPVRAYSDGSTTAIAINSYLTFDIGAGQQAIGVVTDLDSRESFEPDDDELTLQLTKPRRTAAVQLLGTVVFARGSGRLRFDPGISVLPTLDTPAIVAKRSILEAVFLDPPKRNRPEGHTGDAPFDVPLRLGTAVAVPGQPVRGSFNDLLSRPLAVVGNTGSGKSYTVTRLIQEAMRERSAVRSRVFILDINGEYGRAFSKAEPAAGRRPNDLYVNGERFGIPVWLMNTHEVCEWLSAREQAQQPVLVNLWAVAKGGDGRIAGTSDQAVAEAIYRIDQLATTLKAQGPYKGANALKIWEAFAAFVSGIELDRKEAAKLDNAKAILVANKGEHQSFGAAEVELSTLLAEIRAALAQRLGEERALTAQSADKPIYFPLRYLSDPSALLAASRLDEGDNSFRQFLRGLQLRIVSRLQDQRWSTFFNFDELRATDFAVWLKGLGVGPDSATNSEVCVIDCSMIGHEVLPYVCGIIGRLLLDLREHADAESRFHEPWVIVLEEAHNYIRPHRQDEQRGVAVSRETFERIAKEGRKFGMSLIVASQRPSDISPTVLSQCANFVMHRLQNPDDIEHFRRIVPSQSRRLLDQITILAAGEAIAIGSAFNVPARVQVDKPYLVPASQSAAPHLGWHPGAAPQFDVIKALRNWGVQTASTSTAAERGHSRKRGERQ